jgi:hypothetical protein
MEGQEEKKEISAQVIIENLVMIEHDLQMLSIYVNEMNRIVDKGYESYEDWRIRLDKEHRSNIANTEPDFTIKRKSGIII